MKKQSISPGTWRKLTFVILRDIFVCHKSSENDSGFSQETIFFLSSLFLLSVLPRYGHGALSYPSHEGNHATLQVFAQHRGPFSFAAPQSGQELDRPIPASASSQSLTGSCPDWCTTGDGGLQDLMTTSEWTRQPGCVGDRPAQHLWSFADPLVWRMTKGFMPMASLHFHPDEKFSCRVLCKILTPDC